MHGEVNKMRDIVIFSVAIHLTPVRFYRQLGLYKGSAIQKLYRLVETLHHSLISHSSSLSSFCSSLMNQLFFLSVSM
ncbi:hypothetical protein VNO80_04956 [Phaseolus coccineus]|uniref:Uncharacterized protein n=1 Tax=Phaseolus coccineus TaxID=3886 RepID=A0AAN9NZQ2_PHACN